MTVRRVPGALAVGLAALALWQVWLAAAVPAKAVAAQFLLSRAWLAAPADGPAPRPWPGADTRPVGRLTVPRLDIDQIVLAGANGRTLAFGPARLGGTAGPEDPDPVVLFGHRDTHFRFLADLEPGDRVTWREPGGPRRRFDVLEAAVLHKDALAVPRAPVMLLVTCYPFDGLSPDTPLRYAVLLREDAAETVAR